MLPKPKKFFTRYGKKLKVKEDKLASHSKQSQDDAVVTLFNNEVDTSHEKRRREGIFSKIKRKVVGRNIKRNVATVWASLSVIFIFTFLTSVMITPSKARPEDTKRYAIYASEPLVLQEATSTVYAEDSRAEKINEVFKMFRCPMVGLGDTFVYEADKNQIPWWLAAAIAFQESSCGKNTPKIDGEETYNAWGWGVYGQLIRSFESFEKGIGTVSSYLSDQFISRGVTDPCEMMKTYTPGSNGSWCDGVTHFADIIKNYKSPELLVK